MENKTKIKIMALQAGIISAFLSIAFFLPAFASGPNYNDTANLVVTSGANPDFTVNVGIGSATPGATLDVQGTIRATGTISAPGLSTSDWVSVGGTGNVGLDISNTVGIGTSSGISTSLVVKNGNVGIGTWAPVGSFEINKMPFSALVITPAGNVGIGTGNVGIGTGVMLGRFLVTMGDVGIGTWAPQDSLDVVGGNIGISTNFGINMATGTNTLLTLRKDISSIYLGYNAGHITAAGNLGNTAIGYVTLSLITAGSDNTYIGAQDGVNNATQVSSTVVGYNSLSDPNTNDSALGQNALDEGPGLDDAMMGGYVGFTLAAANDDALFGGVTTNDNGNVYNVVGMGGLVLSTAATIQNDVVLGYESGTPNNVNGTINGSNDIWFGYNSGPLGTGDYSNSVAIGQNALAGANNVMALGGTGGNAVNVGIGTFSPKSTLVVSGNAAIGSGQAYTTISAPTAGLIVQGNVGMGTWAANNGALIVSGGNVGIGTRLGGALMTVGNSCAAHEGTGVCWGTSTSGVSCLGYCTAGSWPNCTTCNCC